MPPTPQPTEIVIDGSQDMDILTKKEKSTVRYFFNRKKKKKGSEPGQKLALNHRMQQALIWTNRLT